MEETLRLGKDAGHRGGVDAVVADLKEAGRQAGLADLGGDGEPGRRAAIEGGAQVD